MRRRDLLTKGTAAAGLAASRKVLEPLAKAASLATKLPTVPKRRLGKTGIDLSIIALGGVAAMGRPHDAGAAAGCTCRSISKAVPGHLDTSRS